MTELYNETDTYIAKNLLLENDSDDLFTQINVLLKRLMFLLSKVSKKKVKKLKRCLSSLSVVHRGS